MDKRIFVAMLAGVLVMIFVGVASSIADDAVGIGKSGRKLVTLKDGRKFEGVVTKTDKGVQVETKHTTLTFTNDQIKSIEDLVTPKDDYIARRAKIGDADAEGLYNLAKWVWETYPQNLDVMKYAKADLAAAMKLKKDYTRAALLLRQVDAKIKILYAGLDEGAGKTAGKGKTLADKDMVSKRDILWIRLRELVATDRVTIQYKNKVLQRYIDSMRGRDIDGWDRQGKEERFLAMSRMRQVMEILLNRRDDTALLKDIHVVTNPKFMTDFRSRVWPMIQRSCARAECHGGPRPRGGLRFFVATGKSDKVDYTNFIIVSGFKKGNKRLLNRQDIDSSLLLQYGLNRKISKNPHPRPDIPSLFTTIRSAGYQAMYRWMKSLRGPMPPDYHIRAGFKPAGMKLDTSGRPDIPSEIIENNEK